MCCGGREFCCCGLIHVKAGATIIGVLELLGGIGGLLKLLIVDCANDSTGWTPPPPIIDPGFGISSDDFWVQVVRYGAMGIGGLLLVAAGLKRNRLLYLPYLVVNALLVVCSLFMAFLLASALFAFANMTNEELEKTYPTRVTPRNVNQFRADTEERLVILLFAMFVALLFKLWFPCVVYKAYKLMKEEEEGGLILGAGAISHDYTYQSPPLIEQPPSYGYRT